MKNDGKVHVVTLNSSHLKTLRDLCADALKKNGTYGELNGKDKDRVVSAERALYRVLQ